MTSRPSGAGHPPSGPDTVRTTPPGVVRAGAGERCPERADHPHFCSYLDGPEAACAALADVYAAYGEGALEPH